MSASCIKQGISTDKTKKKSGETPHSRHLITKTCRHFESQIVLFECPLHGPDEVSISAVHGPGLPQVQLRPERPQQELVSPHGPLQELGGGGLGRAQLLFRVRTRKALHRPGQEVGSVRALRHSRGGPALRLHQLGEPVEQFAVGRA